LGKEFDRGAVIMKRLYFVVEGQTEQEFVNTVLRPWLNDYSIYDITPVLIKTSKHGRGGHVNAQHLLNTINGLLRETSDNQLVVTTFIDFFRIPNNMPGYEEAMKKIGTSSQVRALEEELSNTVNDWRFIPYIQRHEFESLLFSSNVGFEKYCSNEQSSETANIVVSFKNPEDINSSPEKAPSKRLLALIPDYDKVVLGNLLALEIGLQTIIDRCPRFAQWIQNIVQKCQTN
jgi:hypothetical protein